MEIHKDTDEKSVRLINLSLSCLVMTLILLINQHLTGDIHILGAYVGIAAGVLLSIPYLLHLSCLAKKGIFFIKSKSGLKVGVVFFAIVVSLGILGGLVVARLAPYCPYITQGSFVRTVFTACFATFSLIAAVGIYWLERCYGEKFYLSKRKK